MTPRFKLNAADKHHIEYLVGKHHVSTSDDEIKADMSERCAHNKIAPDATKQVLAYAVKAHHKNRDFYCSVMSGRL